MRSLAGGFGYAATGSHAASSDDGHAARRVPCGGVIAVIADFYVFIS